MKTIFLLAGMFLTSYILANKKARLNSRDTIQVSGSISLASVGYGPVPSFLSNGPIINTLITVQKNKFSAESGLAMGLNKQPWQCNYGLRYIIARNNKFAMRTGVSTTIFFTGETTAKNIQTLYARQVVTEELTALYKLSYRVSIISCVQAVQRLDGITPAGHLFMAGAPVKLIKKNNAAAIVLQPQVFYFNFDGGIQAVFVSSSVESRLKKMPLSFNAMAAYPVWAKFQAVFQASACINYNF